MNTLKNTVVASLIVGSLIAACFLIWFSYRRSEPTPTDTMLLNVLLLLLSSIATVLIGYCFAKMTTSEKVDTIAERSTEKMVHLSLQLHHLKEYLEETGEVAEEEQALGSAASSSAYRHRTIAAADIAASLAASNETFRSDWLGVVSNATKKRIEKRYDTLRMFMQDYETIQNLQRAAAITSEGSVDEELKEAERRIESVQRSLPLQPSVIRHSVKPPAVQVSQISDIATSSQHTGKLIVNVIRPVFFATGSGKFTPSMPIVPQLHARLSKGPEELDTNNFRVSPGTGTGFDFNIGFRSTAYGVHLPLGEYIFEYEATLDNRTAAQAPEA